MDAARYARIRELFLATEELSTDKQEDFLREKVGDDQQLFREVLSLLAEHDAELARREGEHATPVNYPVSSGSSPSPLISTAAAGGAAQQTRRGDTAVGRKGGKPNPGKAPSTRRGISTGRGKNTMQGTSETHVSGRRPRSATKKGNTLPPSVLWENQLRRNRRWNTGWLWLAAVIPTALVGWWTYKKVAENIRLSIHRDLAVVADSISFTTQQLLDGQARLVESWSRQLAVRQAIEELVVIARQENPTDQLRQATQGDRILEQLQELSGREDIKFVVWDRSGMTLASWLKDRADVGNSIAPEGAENLARVMRGENVLFGPERLEDYSQGGFVPETSLPVMAILVPIRSSDEKVIACMLVRGIGLFAAFDSMLQDRSSAGGLDAYAVNRDGIMTTNSPIAISRAKRMSLEIAAEDVAARMRVSDPGVELTPSNIGKMRRSAQPLTYAAADVSTGNEDVRIEPYNNYAGVPVVGAWRWNSTWQLGLVIEREAKAAFAPARFVRYGFLLLGSLLSLSALAAASQIAKQSAQAHAAVHPLSRYDLMGELGRGGMGVVYRAKHRQLGRDTALKVLRGDRTSEEDRLRFDREAKLAASLNSPHTVKIYDYGIGGEGEAFCVMEFLKGITLYEVVARGGHQSFGRTLTILRQICESLGEAHLRGLLHRDVKPQNVMLSLDATFGDWAVVFDFGLAKSQSPAADAYQTAETVWAGTPMYMAPERYRNPAGVDPRSDLYSVGCVAYFLLSGRPPYLECDPESLFALVLSEQPIGIATHRDEDVPADINALVMRCMAKSVEDRFASIEKLAEAIDQLRLKYPWSVDEAHQWWANYGSESV